MTKMVGKHWLCQKLSGLYQTDGACFHHSIRQCNGACIQGEAVATYNKRAEDLLDGFKLDRGNVLIIDQGRENDERSLVRGDKRFIRVPLDARGSWLWDQADGERTVGAIAVEFRRVFPEDDEQVEQRVSQYVGAMIGNGFMEIRRD